MSILASQESCLLSSGALQIILRLADRLSPKANWQTTYFTLVKIIPIFFLCGSLRTEKNYNCQNKIIIKLALLHFNIPFHQLTKDWFLISFSYIILIYSIKGKYVMSITKCGCVFVYICMCRGHQIHCNSKHI